MKIIIKNTCVIELSGISLHYQITTIKYIKMRTNLFYKPKQRFLKIACIDEIGQDKKTFTVDENGKQNSPSFDSYCDFLLYTDKLQNIAYKTDLKFSKLN